MNKDKKNLSKKLGGEPVLSIDKTKVTGLTKEKKALLKKYKGKSSSKVKPIKE